MLNSPLTCTVVEARELRTGKITGAANPYVVLTIEG